MADVKEVQKKIILLGDGAVGKTSLIRRFVVDKFDDKYILTIGSKVTAKALQIETEKEIFYLKLQIWDILGQKGYTKLHESSFRGTDGVMMVADLTRKDTLESIRSYWLPEVKNIVGTVPFVILANKSDLIQRAEFKEEDLRKFASKFMVPFFFTSAKNGENVKDAFHALGNRVLEVKRTASPLGLKSEVDESEKGEMADLIDKIIDDFCKEYGSISDAMPLLRKQFELAELDLTKPSKGTLKLAVERLAMIEKGYKEWEIAETNRVKRLKWIKDFDF
ncbi:MAG: GTP-binding protein [Thermoplasmata archaeon]|nr:MAG: GTP-binding protein [Thermoplasmata archaeon]